MISLFNHTPHLPVTYNKYSAVILYGDPNDLKVACGYII